MAIQTVSTGFVHAALFYRGDEEYLGAVLPCIEDGLARGEAVVAALPAARLELVRSALGASAGQVMMSVMEEVGRNPARTFGLFGEISAQVGSRRIRMVAEPVWPGGRTAQEYPACVQNEALWNAAFADTDVLTLCPYDAAGLPEAMITDARMTHPLIWCDGTVVDSDEYAGLDAYERYNEPLPVDATAASFVMRTLEDLSSGRTFAARYAESAGLPPDRIGDLQLIVSELATNSLKYTDDLCRMALWEHDHYLICQISDRGTLKDPLVGRRLPDLHAPGGRGLYLVNALADLVRTYTADTGTTIQTFLKVPA